MTWARDRKANFIFIIFFVLLPVIHFFSRYDRIHEIPIFNDEAFYIHWAQIIHDDPSSLWISKVDGKSPLFFWANALTFGFFDDPLESGRFVSILSGSATMVLLFACGLALRRPRAGVAAQMLYLTMPLAIFNDALATVDAFHTCLVIAALFMTIVMTEAKSVKPWMGAALGIALSAAFYAKTPTLLFAPMPALTILALRRDRFTRNTLAGLAIAYSIFIAAVIFYLTRDVEMIGADGSAIFHRSRFFIPPKKLMYLPVENWMSNLGDLRDYISHYFGKVSLAALLAALSFAIIKRHKTELVISAWTMMPVVVVLIVTKETFSRYYLVMLTPILFFIGLEADRLLAWIETRDKPGLPTSLSRVVWGVASIAMVVQAESFMDSRGLALQTKMIGRDRWQYFEGYPSGYGIDKVVEYLKKAAVSGKITVFTTMSWGVPDDAMWLYLRNTPNARVIDCFWWDKMPIFNDRLPVIPILNDKFTRKPSGGIPVDEFGDAYFVTRSDTFPRPIFEAANAGAVLVLEAKKPGGKDSFLVYKLAAPPGAAPLH